MFCSELKRILKVILGVEKRLKYFLNVLLGVKKGLYSFFFNGWTLCSCEMSL